MANGRGATTPSTTRKPSRRSAGGRRHVTVAALACLLIGGSLAACKDTLDSEPDADTDQADANYDRFDGNWVKAPGALQIDPSPVVFEVEELGLGVTRDVTLTNVGDGSLVVFQLGTAGARSDEVVLEGADLPIGLMPGESQQVQLSYTPANCNPAESLLVAHWSDDIAPRLEVPLTANGMTGELEVAPEFVAFGRVGAGNFVVREVEVTNLGACPLHVEALELLASESFSLVQLDAEGNAVFEPDYPLEVTKTEPLRFGVAYFAENDVPESGLLRVHVAETEDHLEVTLSANQRECPVAVALGTIEGSDAEPSDLIETYPLTTLLLDASESYDPDRELTSYQWTVTERPDFSTAQLEPSGDVPNPTFFVDLAGEYRFELNVFDDDGLISCEPDYVTLLSVPNEDIHVQLVWRTPGDANELDGRGTDLDLHLLRIPGTWDAAPDDCHWKNMEPNWGDVGSADDDPSLDIDDTNGVGPENINLDEPRSGVTYAVGVYYYSDRDMGPSFATVRIFIDGIQVFEIEDHRLSRTGDFWDIARIEWPTPEIVTIDEMYFGFP